MKYFKQPIWDSSRRAKPLYDILCVPPDSTPSNSKHRSKKTKGQRSSNEKIDFKTDHSIIVESFTEELKSPKIMAYLNFSLPLVVHCDTSEKRLEVALYQEQNWQMKVISHTSRTQTSAEKNYNLHSGKL